MQSDLKAQVRKLQLEIDVRQATLEILKKDPGTDPKRLTNAEKAAVISSLRPKWKLKDLLALTRMAKSSYEYAAAALARPESAERADARAAVVGACDDSGGAYGFRRSAAQTGIGEWTVRAIMGEESLGARAAKKKRRYSSYRGEVSEAPDNLLRDERGKHHFKASAPNELWVTDVTEFRIPAGKSYLSYSVSADQLGLILLKKDEPMTVKVTRTILLLPEEAMRPRLADSRIGIFLTDMSRINGKKDKIEDFSVINRWNIQPKDLEAWKRGELVEPVKPIVFYLDDAFPALWREPIRRGVLRWNKAFEKIGFKNVMHIEDFPKDDPEFDPDNQKYTCIRYVPAAETNALGPT